jgi:maleylpyruvate isomerase
MILYGYPMSSASYRVRIALALKGIEVTTVTKQLRRGEQRAKDFLEINPQGFVPVLSLDDGQALPQSLAIIEYLDEVYPQPPLLPASPIERARVRALSLLIACDIHPLNNLRVL